MRRDSDEAVALAFDRGRRVRLSGEPVKRGNGFAQVLMIDLLDSGCATAKVGASGCYSALAGVSAEYVRE